MAQAPTLLLTRPEPQSRAFARNAGFEIFAGRIVISPLLAIEQVDRLPDIPDGASLVFTSANGVEAASSLLDLRGRQGYAVGDRTAELARAKGVECQSASGTVEELLTLLLSTPLHGPIMHLSGEVTRGDLVGRLRAAGLHAHHAVVYRQRGLPLTPEALAVLSGAGPVITPLFSPRSARLLRDALPIRHATLEIIAMSSAIAEVWNGMAPVTVVPTPTAVNMCEAVIGAALRHIDARQ